jgi:diaminohydroxyphosphoribosylaminopyrimidine deaminase/5-amino-6-(5-phosphoribosylamino)uracil reductase
VLAVFGERGIKGLLVEGGGRASAGFLRKGLVDKMTFFYAPKILGSDGVPAVGPLGLERVADAGCYGVSSIETFGDDFAVTLYPKDRLEEDDVHRAG